jgi:hypothetical protein
MKPKLTLITLLILPGLATVFSQTSVSPSPTAESEAVFKQQIAELQVKVKQLEATFASQPHGTTGAPSAGMSAGGRMQMRGMSTHGMNMGRGMGQMNPTPALQAEGGPGMMRMMGDMSMMNEMMRGMMAGGGIKWAE